MVISVKVVEIIDDCYIEQNLPFYLIEKVNSVKKDIGYLSTECSKWQEEGLIES